MLLAVVGQHSLVEGVPEVGAVVQAILVFSFWKFKPSAQAERGV